MNISKLKFIPFSLIVCAMTFILSACIDSTTKTGSETDVESSSIIGDGTVSYVLDWDMTGVSFSADGASWTAQSPLGYTITITDGDLTNASVQLINCSEITSDFSLIKTAAAGHGDELDPTFISGPFIDSLTEPSVISVGTVADLGGSYCQGHYVVAGQNSTDLPSITLLGEWSHDESGESGIIALESSLAWGQVHDLPRTVDFANGQAVVITVTRQLGTIFDTADFQEMTDSEIDRAVLRQLTSRVEFNLTGNN